MTQLDIGNQGSFIPGATSDEQKILEKIAEELL